MGKALTINVINGRRQAPSITDDERAAAGVVLDAALIPDPRLWEHGELYSERGALERAARREYLRAWPRCIDIKPGVRLYVSRVERTLGQTPASGTRTVVVGREFHYQCLICREDVATLGDDGVRSVVNSFWRKLDQHTLACAARFVLGEIKASKPPKAGLQPKSADPAAPRKKRKRQRRTAAQRAAAKERARERRMARWPGPIDFP